MKAPSEKEKLGEAGRLWVRAFRMVLWWGSGSVGIVLVYMFSFGPYLYIVNRWPSTPVSMLNSLVLIYMPAEYLSCFVPPRLESYYKYLNWCGNSGLDAARRTAAIAATQRTQCQSNLQHLTGVKERWGIDNDKRNSDVPTEGDLFGLDKKFRTIPRCPSGGKYTLNARSEHPVCSVPDHTLRASGMVWEGDSR